MKILSNTSKLDNLTFCYLATILPNDNNWTFVQIQIVGWLYWGLTPL